MCNDAYVNIDEAEKAVRNGQMFNVVYNKNCFMVDIIPLNENDPYEIEKFKRKVSLSYRNKTIYVIAPEDLIITKILWSKSAGGSERQLRDCAGIFKLNADTLDMGYINKWAQTLGVERELQKIIS